MPHIITETIEEMTKKQNEQLNILYKKWLDRIHSEKQDFFSEEYSNPYLIEVPDNWNIASIKIMFVGEEGRGSWGKEMDKKDFKPITYNNKDFAEDLQKYYRSLVLNQLRQPYNDGDIDYKFKYNRWRFWQTIRKFAEKENIAIIANNADKFWKNRMYKCALNDKERELLHSNDKILIEEIEIVKPTHIVFLGWHEVSISAFLNSNITSLGKFHKYKKEKNILFSGKDIGFSSPPTPPTCFSYHPVSREIIKKYNICNYVNKICDEIEEEQR